MNIISSLHTADALVTCYSDLYRQDLYNAGRRKERQAADFSHQRRKLQQVQQSWNDEADILSLMKPRFIFHRRRKEEQAEAASRRAMYVLSI
jgi:hypothetical protein